MFQNLRLLFLRFFIAVREINYPSYFIDYYEIHLKKNVLHLVIPLITQANPAVLGRIRRVFAVDISENNVIRHGERKFVRRGWAWMVNGSFHISLKTLLDWPETLTLSCKLLKLGCDWLSWLANYPGNY